MLKLIRELKSSPWFFGLNGMHSLFFGYSKHGLIPVCNLYRTYKIAFQQKQKPMSRTQEYIYKYILYVNVVITKMNNFSEK